MSSILSAAAATVAGFAARPDFWTLVSIPPVAALVTWIHVWMAMLLLFWPIEFMGVPPWLGWQGVVPRKARKMAGIVVENSLAKLGSVKEFFTEMDPHKIALHAAAAFSSRVEEFTDAVMQEQSPVLWANLPLAIKRRVYAHVQQQIPNVMEALLMRLHQHIDELVDIDALIVKLLTEDKSLLVRIFKEVGSEEIRFVVRISFWIGLFFGGVQMVLWYFFPWQWGLPLYAAVLGVATNWVALNMVFRPLEPVRIGPWRLQGLFLKRQPQVVARYANLTTTEVITVGNISREIFTGSKADRGEALIRQSIWPLVDSVVIRIAMGPSGYERLQRAMAPRIAGWLVTSLAERSFNVARGRDLEGILATRMRALPPAEFQALLRPAFQEDEVVFLVLGAVTGLLAGGVQMLLGVH
ncbi:MAG: hypothetical protein QM742_17130 [Aquabacterium sp.]